MSNLTRSRRQFLRRGSLALGAVTAGSLRAKPLESADGPDTGRRTAGFGWELFVNNNFGAVYVEVRQPMMLNTLDADLAYTITAAPSEPGLAECLFRAGVTRGTAPNLDPAVYPFPQSPDFGDVQASHPENFYGYDHIVLQDVFYQVILKSWVPLDGTASATSRFTHVEPRLKLNAGDYLVFQGGGDGVLGGDVEMQVVLGYTVGSGRTRPVARL